MDALGFFGEALAIAHAFSAAYCAFLVYGLYCSHRSGIGWLAVTASLLIIALQRAGDLATSTGVLGQNALFSEFEWLLLSAISAFQIYAFGKIKSVHDEERQADEEAMVRIRSFEARQAQKSPRSAKKR
jgi:hypothetical protein